MSQLRVDNQWMVDVLQKLVQIDSRNPSLTPGSPGEAEIGAYIAGLMREMGLAVTVHDLGDNRVNVVAILPGTGGGKTLMLNGHIDTVGVEGMAEPFSGAIRDGKLYGRGSFDMLGDVAAQIAMTKALVDGGVQLAGDLIVTFVADEEFASIGTEDIVRHYSADAAIVTEPTGFGIVTAHRGFVWFEVEVRGVAAHGSQYTIGVDANMRMGRFLAELDKLEQELRTRPAHPLVGTPSLHAAQLNGGTEWSAYADRCVLRVERRLNPGETVEGSSAELQAIIDKLHIKDETFDATLKTIFARMPYETSADSPFVTLVGDIVTEARGEPSKLIGAMGWTDAAVLARAGIESILLGCKGDGAHAVEEWVDLESVEAFANILIEIALQYCT